METRSLLWAQDFITAPAKIVMQAAEDISACDFDWLLLNVLHVRPDGSLLFNSQDVNQLPDVVGDALELIKKNGNTKKKISVSVGDLEDFDRISTTLAAFTKNLRALVPRYGIDGVDLAYRGPDYSPDMVHVLSRLARAIKIALPDIQLTATLFQASDFWLGRSGLLQHTHTVDDPVFSTFNLPIFEGEEAIPPSQWNAYFEKWLAHLTEPWNNLDTQAAERFINVGANAAGFYADAKGRKVFGREDFSAGIENIRQHHPHLHGAFVWRRKFINDEMAQWANDMRSALNPS